MLRRERTQGQALVEFALTATLIFFLLGAAVDIGLIFLSLQSLHNAAQEGASYGSRWVDTDLATGRVVIRTNTIIDRVRGESGDTGGNGFINLHDLNSNTVDDKSEHGYSEPNITVEVLADPSNDGDPTVRVLDGTPENVPCADPGTTTSTCYIRVTVRTTHDMLFPLLPAFAKTVPLHSAYIMPMRSSLSQGGSSAPTTNTCQVPNFVGQNSKSSNLATWWVAAGFTGTLTVQSGNFIIGGQSLTAFSSVPCTSAITLTK